LYKSIGCPVLYIPAGLFPNEAQLQLGSKSRTRPELTLSASGSRKMDARRI
jgi:hypothetical protein